MPNPHAVAPSSQKKRKGGMKATLLTEYFPRRSSNVGSSPQSSSQPPSQPGSSQPGPSQSQPQHKVKPPVPAKLFYASSATKDKASVGGNSTSTPVGRDAIPSSKKTPGRVSTSQSTSSPSILASSRAQREQIMPPSKRKHDEDSFVELDTSSVLAGATFLPSQHSAPFPPISHPSTPRKELPQTPRRSSNKRPRLTSPRKAVVDDTDDLVPSSQSDEQEMTVEKVKRVDPREVVETVESWRLGAAGLSTPAKEPLELSLVEPIEPMDVDIPADLDFPVSAFSSTLSPCSSSAPSPMHSPKVAPRTPSKAFAQFSPVTPPASSPEPELSPPVVPLDSKSKTAQIIAQIRADAARAVPSSPEDEEDRSRRIPNLDDSSDEDEDDWNPFSGDKKLLYKKGRDSLDSLASTSASRKLRSQSALTPTLTSPDSDSPPQSQYASPNQSPSPSSAAHKYMTRTRSRISSTPIIGSVSHAGRSMRSTSSPAPTTSSRPSRTRRAPVPKDRMMTTAVMHKKKVVNPLEALLREKKTAERQGRGIDALRRAEGHDVDALMSDFVDEDEDEAAFADEDAARRAAGLGITMRFDGDKGDGEGPHGEDQEVDAEDRERLLGEKEGKAVGKILDGDRGASGHLYRALGVRIWAEDEGSVDEMVLDGAFKEWPEEEGEFKDPLVDLLSGAVKRKDFDTVSFILNTKLLYVADLSQFPGVVRWLCAQALLAEQPSAFHFIRHIQTPSTSVLPMQLVVQTFAFLGMRDEVLSRLRTDEAPTSRASGASSEKRVQVAYRFVALVSAFAKSGVLNVDEMPETILAVLLMGMDVDASVELRLDVQIALGNLCAQLPQALEPKDAGASIEAAVAVKVLDYSSSLSVPNQAHLLALFQCGSTSAGRIARCVAHHLLSGLPLTQADYVILPSLSPLIDVLDDIAGLFEVADGTDYDVFSARVDVLAVALSGIEGYVAEEGALRRMTQVASLEGSPRKTKDPVPLELIKNRLDVVHGRIVDTRAAHLDRSRAKAALQRLSLRVFYQRAAAQNSGQRRLRDFWSRASREAAA